MAQHTPKVPMQDDEISMHKPVCAELASFRAGIRCAERVYQVDDLVRQVNHWTDEWSDVRDENQSLRNKLAAIEDELETERIRLAACGVVAMADTPESAAKQRQMLPKYWSASCGDVVRRVDECMALRAQVAALEAQVEQTAKPVAWMVYWGVGDMKPAFPPHRDKAFAEYMASQIKSVTEVRALYTSPPKAAPLTDEQTTLAAEAVAAIMTQVQVFASAYSLIGSRFDGGHAQEDADDANIELRTMVVSLAREAARITPATVEKEGE